MNFLFFNNTNTTVVIMNTESKNRKRNRDEKEPEPENQPTKKKIRADGHSLFEKLSVDPTMDNSINKLIKEKQEKKCEHDIKILLFELDVNEKGDIYTKYYVKTSVSDFEKNICNDFKYPCLVVIFNTNTKKKYLYRVVTKETYDSDFKNRFYKYLLDSDTNNAWFYHLSKAFYMEFLEELDINAYSEQFAKK